MSSDSCFLAKGAVECEDVQLPYELKIYQLSGTFARGESQRAKARAALACANAITIAKRVAENKNRSQILLDRKPRNFLLPKSGPQ